MASARGHYTIVDSAVQVADMLEEWFNGGAADGSNIMPPWLPTGLTDFVDLVIPELQRRDLFCTAYAGRTLRPNLGLPFPVNGHAAARAAAGCGVMPWRSRILTARPAKSAPSPCRRSGLS